jgi:hypothetical protein
MITGKEVPIAAVTTTVKILVAVTIPMQAETTGLAVVAATDRAVATTGQAAETTEVTIEILKRDFKIPIKVGGKGI